MKKKSNEQIKDKKNKMPIWAIVLIIIFGGIPAVLYIITFIVFGYFALTDLGSDDLSKKVVVEKVNNSYYDITNKQYVIEGIVENKTNKNYNSVEIEYYLYDQSGAVITTSKAYIENIKAHEKWHFRAKTDEDIKNVTTYKLNEITGNNFID